MGPTARKDFLKFVTARVRLPSGGLRALSRKVRPPVSARGVRPRLLPSLPRAPVSACPRGSTERTLHCVCVCWALALVSHGPAGGDSALGC